MEDYLDKLTTDYIFEQLIPSFINVNGDLYHFNMIKGNNGITIIYKTNSYTQSETDNTKYYTLFRRRGDNLRDVCGKTIRWLIEFDFVKYMPYGFKERYDMIFNPQVTYSKPNELQYYDGWDFSK